MNRATSLVNDSTKRTQASGSDIRATPWVLWIFEYSSLKGWDRIVKWLIVPALQAGLF